MAHPVRPDAYEEINNFYTVTIYEKGAEVVRMMQTLVSASGDEEGRQGFAKGMKLYFERHDGQAVTCDDFAQAIADANPQSPLAQMLPQFKRWYSQAGTPRVHAQGSYNSNKQSYTLTLSQSCVKTPDQNHILGPKRMPQLPDVPTLTEQGYPAGFLSWYGLFGPSSMPNELVSKLNALLNRWLVLPEIAALFEQKQNAPAPLPKTPEAFAAMIQAELPVWRKMMQTAKIEGA
jgi:aminopeptidase N